MRLCHLSSQPIPPHSDEQSHCKRNSGASLRELAKETQVRACELPLDIIKPPPIELPLTQEILKYYLYYEPESGAFVWLRPKAQNLKRGYLAGTFGGGYIHIKVHGDIHLAHRLTFLYMTGDWPKFTVDHINRNREDNRWCNLRDVTNAINCANSRARQFKDYGVYWRSERCKWVARPWVNGKPLILGSFNTKELAIKAVQNFINNIDETKGVSL